MSRRSENSHKKWVYIIAIFPLLAVGYIAGNYKALGYAEAQLGELQTPGELLGNIFASAGLKSNSSKVTLAIEPRHGSLLKNGLYVPERARKAGRYDIYGDSARATIIVKTPRKAVAAISPYDRERANATSKNPQRPTHVVNRKAKGGLLNVAVTRVAKLADDGLTYHAEQSGQATAKLFFDMPLRTEDYRFVTLTEVDRSQVQLASLKPEQEFKGPEAGAIVGRPRHRLYYGALMGQGQRRKEMMCLAKAIYFESRGEPVRGQMAVAQVVMNRVRERYYPNTVCGVVFEGVHRRNKCQFSFACDGKADIPRDRKLWAQAIDISIKTINGKIWLKDIGHASHYHATYVKPRWIKLMRRIKRIGVHVFYRGRFLPKVASL